MGTRRLSVFLCAALCGSSASYSQTNVIWANVGTDFSLGANWIGGVAPVNDLGSSVVEFGNPSPSFQPALATSYAVNGVRFASGAGSFTLSGTGPLAIGSSGLNNLSAATQTVSVPLSFGTSAPAVTNNGTLSITGSVTNNTTLGLIFSGAGSGGTVAGVIGGGGGGIDKQGSGTWVLSGANTYSGGTTINEGTLKLDTGGSLPVGGNLTLNATGTSPAFFNLNGLTQTIGTLTFGGPGASSSTFTDIFIGPGPTGTLTLGGNVTYDPTNNPGPANISGGNVVLGGNRTFNIGDSANAFSELMIGSNLTGTGNVTKTGAGTLQLAGNNTFAGNITIQDGRLQTGGNNTTTSAAILVNQVTSNKTATLDGGSGISSVGPVTLSGVGGSTNTLTIGPGGALTIASLTLAGPAGSTNTVGLSSNSTLTLGGNLTYDATNNPGGVNISGGPDSSGALVLSSGAHTFLIGDSTSAPNDLSVSSRIGGAGGLIKAGPGTMVINSANNDYTGQTLIQAGVLAVSSLSGEDSNSSLGSPYTTATSTIAIGSGATGATLRFIDSGSFVTDRTIDLAGTTGGATLDNFGSGSVTFAGPITASGAGSKTLILAGNNSLTSSTISGAISDNSPANRTSVLKTGFGTWILSGGNTYTGGTTVNNGTLRLSGTGGSALPTGGNVIVNATTGSLATLDLNNSSQSIGTLALGGAGASSFATNSIVLGSEGTLTLGGGVTYDATNNPSGAVISAAALFIEAYPFGGTLSLGSATRTFNIGDSTTVTNDLTVYSNIAAGATGVGLIKSGAGALVLAGQSTYQGDTTVSAGTLFLASSTNDADGRISGPVGRGTLVLQSGTTLAATGLFTSYGSFVGDVTLSNPVSLANNVTLGSLFDESHNQYLNFSGIVNATAASAAVHLGGFGAIEFSGTLDSTTAGTAITFDTGGRADRGFVLMTGSIGGNVATVTADRAALIFGTPASLATTANVKVTNNGYVSVGVGDAGLIPSPTALLARITPADKTNFSGTFGFDTHENSYYPQTFSENVDFSGFGANFTIGSLSSAILEGTITPPSTGYTFGNGGGVLIVRSNLADAGGSKSVSVNSSPTIPENALGVVFQGNNTYSGNLSVTNSFAILDSPNALPAGRTFTLGASGYLGYTEAFTGAPSFASFVSRLATPSSYTPTSVLGFDSTGFVFVNTVGSEGNYGNTRIITEALDLSGLSSIYIGTATSAELSGRILAPNQGGANRTLSLIATRRGDLTVVSPLLTGNVSQVVIGSAPAVLGSGRVELRGDSTYSGGTTLLSGTLALTNNTRLNGSTILSSPIGTGTLTVPSTALNPVLMSASYDDLVLYNPITLGSLLQLGFANFINAEVASALVTAGYYNGGNRIVLNGAISNQSANAGGLELWSDTVLNGANTFSGGVTLRYGTVTIGHDTALGSGTLNLAPSNYSSVSLDVANGPRTIANNVVINAFSNDTIGVYGNGSLTINGSVALNSGVTFAPDRYPLFLNGNVTGSGRLGVYGNNAVVLGGTNTYSGGTLAGQGAIIFGTAASIPATNSLTADYYGYIGVGFVPTNLQSGFIDRFNKISTFGTIGLDSPVGGPTNTFSSSINFADPDGSGPATGFDYGVRLGSATTAIVTGTITPQGGTYQFGGGGGLLEVNSGLVDGAVGSRYVAVNSPQLAPLTLRLGGTNTYTGGISTVGTQVYSSALIFKAGAMPSTGRFAISGGGYIGTEDPSGLAAQALIDRLDGSSHYGIIGFDSFSGSYNVTGTLNLLGLNSGANIFLGTATQATINATSISLPSGQTEFRFAGYKGGQLTVATALDGARSVAIGDPNNPATAGSPTNPSLGFSTVTLSGNNTYGGGTNLYGGQLLLGRNSALGSGSLYIGRSYWFDQDSPFATPVLGASVSADPSAGGQINLPNTLFLENNLRLSGSFNFTLSGSIRDGEGSGILYKSGNNSVTLSGNNTFSDGIYVEQGNLTLASFNAAGRGPVQLGGPLSPSVTVAVSALVNGIAGESSLDVINIANGQTLNINQTFDAQYAGVFSSSGASIIYQGPYAAEPTRLRLSGSSSYNGGTRIDSGIVVVAANNNAFGPSTAPANVVTLNGGKLALDTGVTLTNSLTLTNGALGGVGTFKPPATLSINGSSGNHIVLAPGLGGPGTMSFDGSLLGVSNTLNLAGGGVYWWQLMDATNASGGWDLVTVTGTVDISANVASPFNFKIVSLGTDGNFGLASNFNPGVARSWTVLTASSITGFTNSGQFAIDSSLFQNGTGSNPFAFNFSVSGSPGGPGSMSLVLNFDPLAVPEPSTYALIVIGLGGVGFVMRRRRK